MLKSTLLTSRHISDNLYYIIDNGHVAVVVDPVDADDVEEYLERENVQLSMIVVTHNHPDHFRGVAELHKRYPDAIVGYPRGSARKIAAQTGVKQGYFLDRYRKLSFNVDDFRVLQKRVRQEDGIHYISIVDIPGHTMDHIGLYSHDLEMMWSGDCIFNYGIGNCNDGNPRIFFHTFQKVFNQLPNTATICCGHDYTLNNLKFCSALNPDNAELQKLLKLTTQYYKGQERKSKGGKEFYVKPVLPVMSHERKYNPFFRYDDPELQQLLEERFPNAAEDSGAAYLEPEERTFVILRYLRNLWDGKTIGEYK